jgi:linoleoyl-CoA desaturase
MPIETANKDFINDLYSRSKEWLTTHGRHANAVIWIKTILLIAVYILSFLWFCFYSRNIQEFLLSAVVLGLCHVLIPVNIAHDAIHGAFSPNRIINQLALDTLYLSGTNAYMYRRKHLEAHAEKENGSKKKAIEVQGLLLKQSKGNNLPAVFYIFYAEYMIFIRDFQLFFSDEENMPTIEYVKLFVLKAVYLFAFLVLPFLLLDLPSWQILCGILLMYLIVTISLVIILLMPTEKMENARVEIAGRQDLNNRWAIEILEHNVDFSPNSNFLNLLAGGAHLNVVHYLFPTVNHVHYPHLAKLIEETAKEHGLIYRKQSVKDVFGIHFNYLKKIGEA